MLRRACVHGAYIITRVVKARILGACGAIIQRVCERKQEEHGGAFHYARLNQVDDPELVVYIESLSRSTYTNMVKSPNPDNPDPDKIRTYLTKNKMTPRIVGF